MVKLGVAVPGLPALLYPIFPAFCLFGLAWLVASYLEPVVKRGLQEGLEAIGELRPNPKA
jgi:hypothetical protein